MENKTKSFEEKLRKAALHYLHVQDIDIAMENFRGWIICREPVNHEIGHIFIKLAGQEGKFEDVDSTELRKEFEEVAAIWLAATDPDDCLGPIRCDVINLFAMTDRALLRWQQDAINGA